MKKIDQKINWRLFIRNRRYLLYSIGLGLLSLSLAYFAMYPIVTNIIDSNKKLQKETKMKTQLEQKLSQLRELQAGDVSARQQLVNQVFPSRKPVLELLTGLNVVAARSGVLFTDFQVSPGEIATEGGQLALPASPKKTAGYDSVVVRLTVEGTFEQVQAFFREVESIAPLTTVSAIQLSLQKKQAGEAIAATDKASAELVLQTYFYTQSLTAALTAPLPAFTAENEAALAQLDKFTFPTVEQQRQIISDGVYDLFEIEAELPEEVVQ